jgi:hypothetical protein
MNPGLDLIFNIGDVVSLEPGISYGKTKDEEDNSVYKSNKLLLGLKSAVILKRDKVLITPGFYLGTFSEKRERTEDSAVEYDLNQSGFIAGPVVGLEYLVSKNFSLGTDTGYIFANSETISIQNPKSKESEQYINGAIKFRFYFY